MATGLKNLSDYDSSRVPEARDMRFGIVVAEWNEEITAALCEAVVTTLKKHGVIQEDITIKVVPGTIELTFAAKMIAENMDVDAVICLGCVIRGETPHFDYVCESATYGITELNLSYEIPFIFGVLTTDTLQQARDRAGGRHGNKGDEAAVTAIKMVHLNRNEQ
jgi:6,7-dimethyl-8-ribityllumazine synthase